MAAGGGRKKLPISERSQAAAWTRTFQYALRNWSGASDGGRRAGVGRVASVAWPVGRDDFLSAMGDLRWVRSRTGGIEVDGPLGQPVVADPDLADLSPPLPPPSPHVVVARGDLTLRGAAEAV